MTVLWTLLLGFSAVYAAEVEDHGIFEVVLTQDQLRDLTPDRYEDWLEQAAGRAPAEATGVRLVVEASDGTYTRVVDHLPRPAPTHDSRKERESQMLGATGMTEGALSGKAIYLSQCHGWIWSEVLDRFATQRGNVWDTVEDFHNPEAMNQYLTHYLENAGALVYTAKERDLNTNSAIVDNGDDGYGESGDGFENGWDGFGYQDTYAYNENPFEMGTSREFPAGGGAVASWIPAVPQSGHYGIYVSWNSSSANAPDAHYRLSHQGGVIHRYFDQTVHGYTWQYVTTLWLEEGEDSLTIELVGDSAYPERMLSADAVRIGGGMGVISRHGETTERPRWEGGAIQHTQFNGAPDTIYDPWWDGDGSDPSSRSLWAEWEHPVGEDALYLSWHSNASSGGGARGTVTYFSGGGPDAPSGYGAECSTPAIEGSYTLSRSVQDELVGMFREFWEGDWQDRGVNTACFAEVNPNRNDEMPAALVELAFHDNEQDTTHIKHPLFRRHAAYAMYRGIVRYFMERDGLEPVFLPDPPTDVYVIHNALGDIELHWEPGLVGDYHGHEAVAYKVYTSKDGLSWDNGTLVEDTYWVVPGEDDGSTFLKVTGLNDGGESFPSEIVGARRSPSGSAPILVVAAFDRFDRGLLRWEELPGSIGWIVRMQLEMMNGFDIIRAHGTAISEAGWPFDSTSDEAFLSMDLSPYSMVVWAAGEESTSDETFSVPQQTKIKSYLNGGGTLWASGAEIFWDLDAQGSGTDQEFASEVLGATMKHDGSDTTVVDGTDLLAGVGPLDFGMDVGATYPVEWPDVLSSDRTVIARYLDSDENIAGVMGDQVVAFGFPFDAIADPLVRTEVANRLLNALIPEGPPTATGDGTEETVGFDDHVFLSQDSVSGCGCGIVKTGKPKWITVWFLGLLLVWTRARQERLIC